jgi:hypothetical protein
MYRIKRHRVFESMDETIYSAIQELIDKNPHLKDKKVEAGKDNVFEAGDFLLLLGDLGHITDAHVEETVPGSKFDKDVDLKKAIVSLVANNEPTEITKGYGPEQAEKFKWLGVDTKVPVGVENVHEMDANSEEFKSMNVYAYKDSKGNEFKIKVKEGDGVKTTFLSFIGGKIGKVGDKTVLSAITAFPGANGASIANRNDLMKNGYYFTTTSKEVIERSTGQVSERVMGFTQYWRKNRVRI